MFESAFSVLMLVAAVFSGYFLGALPIADRLSRRYGVDIFSEGTGLAGASNVRRSVGNLQGVLVIISDISKGIVAVLVARSLGVQSVWLLLPAAAAVIGHWNSIFSGFRGGDGLATLAGATIAIFPLIGIVGVGVAMLAALVAQKMPYSSLLNIVFGYVALVVSGFLILDDLTPLFGMGGLAALVLAHSVLGHRRRHHEEYWSELAENQAAE